MIVPIFSSTLLWTHALLILNEKTSVCFELNWIFYWFKQLLQQSEEVRKSLKRIIQSHKPHGNTSHLHRYANMCLVAATSNICTCTEISIYAGHISYSKWITWNTLNIHNPWYYAINLCSKSDTTTHHFTGAYQDYQGVGRIHMIYVLKQVPCVFHYN